LTHRLYSRFSHAKVVHFSEPSKLFGAFFHKKQRNLKIDFAL